uniref:Decapping nuclease n=1 Tax=Amphilophus citrinellus TaxID=61819 RepID=A0A3Q0T6P3_AMPCI
MDHHISSSSYHKHQSSYKRERDDGGRNPCESKRFRTNNHSRTLSTRKELYERDFPVYKQPVEVGCFSLDSERRFFNDSRQMRYYVEPDRNPHFDLRDGYRDRFIKRDDSVKERLDHILRWMVASKSNTLDVDFVTWRGHLTKLLTTPYETKEGWLLAVTRFRGTFYISEVETETARRERENRTERHEEMMYWGYKFEQYTCADNAHSLPDPGGVVNTNEAFCTVVQTRLADHRLLFSVYITIVSQSLLVPCYDNNLNPQTVLCLFK